MVRRGGNLLERNVSHLFKLLGIIPQNNIFMERYEMDTFVSVKSLGIKTILN